MAEAEYDPKAEILKVSLKLFTDDLEAMLKRHYDCLAYLGSEREDPNVDEFLTEYLKRSFTIFPSGDLNWVGKEVDPDATWLFFTIKLPRSQKKLTIEDSVFFDMFEDQVNILHLKAFGTTQSLYFNKKEPRQTLVLTHG